jgi:hypothetical protein
MSRWLLLSCCLLVLAAIGYAEPRRLPNAHPLGGACVGDRQCQLGLYCKYVPQVMDGQCTASCSSTPACQEYFGTESVCLGADVCARTCKADSDCPTGDR